MGRFLSPSHMNPLNINPLKQLIERFVDFEALRNSDRELFISATNAQTGDLRIFTRDELTAEAVMASACLPLLFRPVEIDGVPYWDGGYVSNPPLLPFLQTSRQRGRAAGADLPAAARARRRPPRARSSDAPARSPSTRRCWRNCAASPPSTAWRRPGCAGGLRLHRIVLDEACRTARSRPAA